MLLRLYVVQFTREQFRRNKGLKNFKEKSTNSREHCMLKMKYYYKTEITHS